MLSTSGEIIKDFGCITSKGDKTTCIEIAQDGDYLISATKNEISIWSL